MKKSFLPVIFDAAFFSFSAFILFLSVFMRKLKPPFLQVLSALLSFFIGIAVFKVLSARKNKSENKRKEKELAELTLFQLAVMKKSELTAQFLKAFNNLKKPFIKYGNVFCLTGENVAYYVCDYIDGAKKADVMKLYNFLKPKETGKIFCLAESENAEEFCKKFGNKISLLSPDETYAFLKNNGALPQIKFIPEKEKPKRFDFTALLNKKKAKNYMVFGLLFTAMSFLVRYKLYYILAGSFFLILSAITLIFGKSEKERR